jgi:replicative DNA helicase
MEVEKAIVSSIIHNKVSEKIIELIKTDIFYNSKHVEIIHAAKDLIKEKSPIDQLTIIHKLKKRNSWEIIGIDYYWELVNSTLSFQYSNIEYWYRILFQKYLQRMVIINSSKIIEKGYDDTNDIFDLIEEGKKIFEDMGDLSEEEPLKDNKSITAMTFSSIMASADMKMKSFCPSGWKNLDNIMTLSPGIMLVAGSSGVGKTSWVTSLMWNLLKNNYRDVSIMWNTIDHETGTKIIRKFISQEILITDKELTNKGMGMNVSRRIEEILPIRGIIEQMDIEFQEKADYINVIVKKFANFCKKRKGKKLNILLIDNIMRLLDMISKGMTQNEKDDFIANTISQCYNDTRKYNSLIIFLHHFTKDQAGHLNLDDGYRPSREHIKGSSRYDDISEQVVLLNRPANYPKLMAKYRSKKEVLEHMFIVDIPKNTSGETGLVHFLTDIKYNYFEEL